MIRRAQAAFRRIRDEEAGLSLTEILVAGMMTIAMMAMIGTMFIQTAKITANSTQTTNSNNVAANAANEATSVVRVAATLAVSGQPLADPAVVGGTNESLTIYSLSNTDADNPSPVRVKFTIDASRNLIEERCTASSSGGFWTFGTCASLTTRNLGGVIQPVVGTNADGVPNQLFTYYKADGSWVSTVSTLAERRAIVAIRIYVAVKAPGSNTGQVVIENKVVLGNLGLENT